MLFWQKQTNEQKKNPSAGLETAGSVTLSESAGHKTVANKPETGVQESFCLDN